VKTGGLYSERIPGGRKGITIMGFRFTIPLLFWKRKRRKKIDEK